MYSLLIASRCQYSVNRRALTLLDLFILLHPPLEYQIRRGFNLRPRTMLQGGLVRVGKAAAPLRMSLIHKTGLNPAPSLRRSIPAAPCAAQCPPHLLQLLPTLGGPEEWDRELGMSCSAEHPVLAAPTKAGGKIASAPRALRRRRWCPSARCRPGGV